MNKPRHSRRGAYQRGECVFIGAWFPKDWIDAMDRLVVAQDADRSKILRRAVAVALKEEQAQ